ncbi:MAG: hypothetical protein M0O99_02720 [Desulfuromonas thiophila]|nr:hypothetical protein [Desulfuromonas thiophila]
MQSQPECVTTQRLLYTLSIHDEDTLLTDHKTGRRFIVSEKQLMGFFRFNAEMIPERGLLKMRTDGLSSSYLFRFPRQKERTLLLKLNKTVSEFKMDIPPLLVQVTIQERSLTDMNIWAFAGRLTKTAPVYELPLPNVSGSSVCLGGTDKSVGRSVRESIERIFFETPFNSHLFEAGKDKIPFTEFLSRFGGKMPFAQLNRLGCVSDVLC